MLDSWPSFTFEFARHNFDCLRLLGSGTFGEIIGTFMGKSRHESHDGER